MNKTASSLCTPRGSRFDGRRLHSSIFAMSLLGCGLQTAQSADIFFTPVRATGRFEICGNEITLFEHIDQRVFFELRVANWDPDQDGSTLLKAYSAMLDVSGYQSGLQGQLSTSRDVPCSVDTDCEAVFGGGAQCEPEFWSPPGTCGGAYIDTARADYVFHGHFPDFATIDPHIELIISSAILDNFVADPGVSRYAGTLIVNVPRDARGTFFVSPIDSDRTALAGEVDGTTVILPGEVTPALITISDVAIPAVGTVGLAVMVVVLIGAGALVMRRRQAGEG